MIFLLVFILTTEPSLFTYGTSLIEAGKIERGEAYLKGLLSTQISLEMRDRILYNLGLSYLQRGNAIEALGAFQQIDVPDSYTKKAIREAYILHPQLPFQSPGPLPTPLTLENLIPIIESMLNNLTALPFEKGEDSPHYQWLKGRLDEVLKRKKEWWETIIARQKELLPKGCDLSGWEEIVKQLGEGTLLLNRGSIAFHEGRKPLGTIYPLLNEALAYLKNASHDLGKIEGKGNAPTHSERVEKLSEMMERDKQPAPTSPTKGLW